MRLSLTSTLLLLLLSPVSWAAEQESRWDVSGNVELQARQFVEGEQWLGQSSNRAQLALAARAEFRWRSEDGDRRASVIPYARWDESDSERNLVDLREAYWARSGGSSEILIGSNTVFWGVTESVHLVDIINQTDAVADIDGEEKLGQPMLNVSLQKDWGLINVYLMPYFRERTFPGAAGRFRSPLPIDANRPVYESSSRENHLDTAVRYSHYVGNVDFGFSVFSGTSREPRLLPSQDGLALIPHYDLIDQAGIDLQYTTDAWLWKLETIVRKGFSGTFAAAVGGFEFTTYQVSDSSTDIGLLLEYQYDGRNEFEPITTADNDVFVGTRIALNDTQDTAILAGFAVDLETGETFSNIEAERRFGENYVMELRVRLFSGADPDDITYSFVRDDYIQFQISRFF